MMAISGKNDCRHCWNHRRRILLHMFIIIAVSLLVLLPGGLLLAPVTAEFDTRTPGLKVEWMGLFRWRFKGLQKAKGSKEEERPRRRKPKKRTLQWVIKKIVKSGRVLKSFRVTKLEIAFDPAEPVLTAYLYALNFYPLPSGRRININFAGENYLLLRITNRPWRILAAWFR